MSNKIKIGVMGCASFAERSAIPTILELGDRFELVAIASRSDKKAEEFAQKFGGRAVVGYDCLVDDPKVQMIYMPLPTELHDEWVLRCLDAGKHVVVEKSMSSTFEAAEKMVAAAKRSNRLLAENFMFQYHRQMQVVKRLIADETVGELRQIRSAFGFPPLPEDNFRFQKELGGGALLDAGAYTLKAAQYFLGRELKVCSAVLTDTLGRGVDTVGAAHLVDSNGISALLGFGFENFYQCNFEVWGTTGKITVPRAFTAKPDFSPEIILEKQGERESQQIEPDHQFKNFLTAVSDAVNDQDFDAFGEEALAQAKLISAVFRASE